MKKINQLLVIASCMTIATSCGSEIKESSVPEKVKQSFAKQFPGITAKWEKEDGKYEAEFKQGGIERSAMFEAEGTMTESETAIPIAELPQIVMDSINTRYHNPDIKEAAKIVLSDGTIQYEAVIAGKDHIFNANGGFIRKEND